jgi:hypothetical protein
MYFILAAAYFFKKNNYQNLKCKFQKKKNIIIIFTWMYEKKRITHLRKLYKKLTTHAILIKYLCSIFFLEFVAYCAHI